MDYEQRPKGDIMLEVRLNETETDDRSRQVYDQIYDQIDISQPASFYRWFYKLLALNREDIFLDISCGQGHLLGLAREDGIIAHGMDLSLQALKIAGQRRGSRLLVSANSQRLPYAEDSFTVISNIGSLEHYLDMPAAVRETARVMKAGGRAVILVPNTFSLFGNVWYAFRHGRTSIDPYQPIQRYAARFEWQALLEDNGLVVTKTIKFERVLPVNRADLAQVLRHPKELVRLLLTPFVPLNLAFCFVYFCEKAALATEKP
jgi:SAM-dependent methyltransferase